MFRHSPEISTIRPTTSLIKRIHSPSLSNSTLSLIPECCKKLFYAENTKDSLETGFWFGVGGCACGGETGGNAFLHSVFAGYIPSAHEAVFLEVGEFVGCYAAGYLVELTGYEEGKPG